MRARLLPCLCRAFFLSAGMSAAALPAFADKPTGEWVGMLVTDQGTCPDHQDSILQVETDRVAFTPATGTLVLRGKPDKNLTRLHAQLMLKDKDGKPLPWVFEGQPDGDSIKGVFGTPNCRAHIVLHRPQGSAWKNFMGD